MDIRCIIEREGGTEVKLDATTYHFKPAEPNGPHIAAVKKKEHVKVFLSIPEAYEPFVEGMDMDEEETDDDLPGPTEPIEQPAAPASAEPVVEERAVIDPQEALLTVMAASTAEDVTRADLDAAFELLHGRKPNPQAKDETVFDRIKDKAAELEGDTGAAE